MSESHQTLLRYVSSKKIDKIISYVNGLPYKIEIKGGIIFDGNKYILSFVIPDYVKEKPITNLDKIGV